MCLRPGPVKRPRQSREVSSAGAGGERAAAQHSGAAGPAGQRCAAAAHRSTPVACATLVEDCWRPPVEKRLDAPRLKTAPSKQPASARSMSSDGVTRASSRRGSAQAPLCAPPHRRSPSPAACHRFHCNRQGRAPRRERAEEVRVAVQVGARARQQRQAASSFGGCAVIRCRQCSTAPTAAGALPTAGATAAAAATDGAAAAAARGAGRAAATAGSGSTTGDGAAAGRSAAAAMSAARAAAAGRTAATAAAAGPAAGSGGGTAAAATSGAPRPAGGSMVGVAQHSRLRPCVLQPLADALPLCLAYHLQTAMAQMTATAGGRRRRGWAATPQR